MTCSTFKIPLEAIYLFDNLHFDVNRISPCLQQQFMSELLITYYCGIEFWFQQLNDSIVYENFSFKIKDFNISHERKKLN